MGEFGLLFPGQGAQYVGMGSDLYQSSVAAQKVFDLANELLDFDIKQLCFEGPVEELQKTEVSQPAILVTSLAVLEALREAGKYDKSKSIATAGLSLGEYTALAAVGSLSYEDAIRIVSLRGQFMQEACESESGGMASVLGLEIEVLETICQEASSVGEIQLASHNSPTQVALAGSKEALRFACNAAKERGAKVFPLKVAGAFHSRLMTPAAEKLAPYLQKININKPRIPFIANVTGEQIQEPDDILECLIKQVDHPVLWVQCMKTLLGKGIQQFLEVGPGKILTGLMRKTDRSVKVFNMSNPIEIENYSL